MGERVRRLIEKYWKPAGIGIGTLILAPLCVWWIAKKSEEIQPLVVVSVHQYEGNVNNKSSLDRPIRRVDFVLRGEVQPETRQGSSNGHGALKAEVPITFSSKDLSKDGSTYSTNVNTLEFGARKEELVTVTVLDSRHKGKVFRGDLTIWHGDPNKPEHVVLRNIWCRIVNDR